MNCTVPGLFLQNNALSEEQISQLLEFTRSQPESKWVHANNILPERGVGVTACNYDMLYDRVLTEDQREFLRTFAPVFPDAIIQTQVINRYRVGGFLCDHTDRQSAIYNTIIPLQSSETDGLRYYVRRDGRLHECLLTDVAGRLTGISDPLLIHGVAPVEKERFVFINIYSAPEDARWNPYQDMYQNQQ